MFFFSKIYRKSAILMTSSPNKWRHQKNCCVSMFLIWWASIVVSFIDYNYSQSKVMLPPPPPNFRTIKKCPGRFVELWPYSVFQGFSILVTQSKAIATKSPPPLLNFWSAKGMNLKFCTDIALIMYFSKIEKKFNDFVIFCWRQQKFGNFGQYYRTSLNVCKMRTKAYFSILFSLTVYKKPKFSKKYGVPGFFHGNADFSLPEFPDVGKILKIRKIPVFLKFSYWDRLLFEISSQINDGTKVMAKSFCEDMTRNFRKFVGWFQPMANKFRMWSCKQHENLQKCV